VRALVTGGRGFVGRWLADHLTACGDEVVVVDREVDVTDERALRQALEEARPDVVYHLAALAHVGQSWQHPSAVFRVNAEGTCNVLAAASAVAGERPPRIVVISSSEVYGSVAEQALPVDESAPLAPVTPYAASKVAAEYLGVQAHLGSGLPVVRARPFNHVGPGQAPQFVVAALATRIVRAQREGRPSLPVGNLAARRDLTDVRDVVRAYRLLAERGEPGEVYNVCSGTAVSMAEVAERLLRLAGAELELVPDPDLFRPVDVPVIVGDPSRLQATTGWHPEIPLEQTLHDVLDHVRWSEAQAAPA
jgi:GDP-4-dehydro-6-deoxy-D-mannose reductase